MFNRAWLAGGIPRTACVAAYEPVCAVSLADSYINRANPGTNDAAPGTAPTWAAETGWKFNGSSQYLKGPPISDWGNLSIIVKLTQVNSNPNRAWGVSISYDSDPRLFLLANYSGVRLQYGNTLTTFGSGVSSGVIATVGNAVYVDGALRGTNAGTIASNFTTNLGIGAQYSTAGGGSSYGNPTIAALYVYNVPITPTQVKAVTDAMNMLPMRPQLPRFRSWLTGGAALTQFRKAFGLRTGSRGVPE